MEAYIFEGAVSRLQSVYLCRTTGVSRRKTGCHGRTLVIGLYFAFWGIYSVAITFTAVSALLAALTGGTAGQLSGAAAAVRSASRF